MILKGTLRVASDKSITHRALMLASMTKGITKIHSPLWAEDTEATKTIFTGFGVDFDDENGNFVVNSSGIAGFKRFIPARPLGGVDAGNSGTTARLMMGVLAGITQWFPPIFGDESLSKRPMKRIQIPLELMGAEILLASDGETLPALIKGSKDLQGITYELPVASAQLKSAILLAGLQAKGTTTIIEPTATRDHTELMLEDFGIEVKRAGNQISIQGGQTLQSPGDVYVPADISQAAFFMVAALIVPDSDITLCEVGINPTRTGILDVLEAMGAQIEVVNQRLFGKELVADIRIKYTDNLGAVEISGDLVPRLIDEIPILALLATRITGVTVIKDAEELKVKESNRLSKTADLLTELGAVAIEVSDGMVIYGYPDRELFSDEALCSDSDHRLAMMLMVANLVTVGELNIHDKHAIQVSYPNFEKDLRGLMCQSMGIL